VTACRRLHPIAVAAAVQALIAAAAIVHA